MPATLCVDKSVRPVISSNIGSAAKQRVYCSAIVGMITAFITLLTEACLCGLSMTTVVTRTPHNATLRTLHCLILFNFLVMFVLKSVYVEEFEVLTADLNRYIPLEYDAV